MSKTATLLVSCPDKKGIVSSISSFLLTHNANILHANQHLDTENNLFLMRLEWDVTDFQLCEKEFQQHFQSIASQYGMTWKLRSSQIKTKLAIMVSKYDHCLADLLYGIPFHHIELNQSNKQEAEQEQFTLLKKFDVDLIILARYMQILSPKFIEKYPQQIINIHHSFLPAFVGAKPYHQAYERGVKLIGATSHYVTQELDGGPIIEQDIARVSHRDQVDDLARRGKDLERIVLSRAVRWHIENRVLLYKNKTVIFN